MGDPFSDQMNSARRAFILGDQDTTVVVEDVMGKVMEEYLTSKDEVKTFARLWYLREVILRATNIEPVGVILPHDQWRGVEEWRGLPVQRGDEAQLIYGLLP